MEVFPVFHEWEEELEEYSTWKEELVAVFATAELAKQYVQNVTKTDGYHDNNHYTYGGALTVREEV